MYPGLNLGPHACWACRLPFELSPPPCSYTLKAVTFCQIQVLLLILLVIWSHLCCLKKNLFFSNPLKKILTHLTGLRSELFHMLYFCLNFYHSCDFSNLNFLPQAQFLCQFKTPILATMKIVSELQVFPSLLQIFLFSVQSHCLVLMWNIGWEGRSWGLSHLWRSIFSWIKKGKKRKTDP